MTDEHDALIQQIKHAPADERLALLKTAPAPHRGHILLHLKNTHQKQLLAELSTKEVIALLNHLDPDKATDLLQQIEPSRAKRISKQLSELIKEKVEFLLKFDPRTAAGLMSVDYILVPAESTFREVALTGLDHEKRTGKFPAILVEENERLMGELPMQELILHHGRNHIRHHVKKIPTITYSSDVNEVLNRFHRNPHNKVLVLDDDQSILGLIHSDDVLELVDTKTAQNLYHFAGVDVEEDVLDTAATKVQHRYKWLIINLGTAYLAAAVVGLFEDTIARYVILATYMPIVAGMGGNAGTQSMAVMVRGLVLRRASWKNAGEIIGKEFVAGAANGMINGLIVASIAVLFGQGALLGLVFMLAMILNLIVAGVAGASIPLVMKSLGKDPAASASIFITTATDVAGFFTFLGLASVLLP